MAKSSDLILYDFTSVVDEMKKGWDVFRMTVRKKIQNNWYLLSKSYSFSHCSSLLPKKLALAVQDAPCGPVLPWEHTVHAHNLLKTLFSPTILPEFSSMTFRYTILSAKNHSANIYYEPVFSQASLGDGIQRRISHSLLLGCSQPDGRDRCGNK